MKYPRVLLVEHPKYFNHELDKLLLEEESQIHTIVQLIKSWYTSGTLGIWSSPDVEETKTAKLLHHEFPKAFFKQFDVLRCNSNEHHDFNQFKKLLDNCTYNNLIIIPHRKYFDRYIERDSPVPVIPRTEAMITFRKHLKFKSKFHSWNQKASASFLRRFFYLLCSQSPIDTI